MGISAHVDDWLIANRERIVGWRRHLHAYPELSHEEYQTTEFLDRVLREHGMTPHRFPTTGLMVDLGPDTEPKVAFRADIDALPLTEVTDLDFASENPGVMHACGHDVHTTVALALACALKESELDVGVRIIFQHAEEVVEGGASEVVEWGALEGVGAIFAVHVEPKLRVGRIGVRTGAITSASDVVRIKVTGSGGHTSRPHLTADVVYALSSLVANLPGLLSRRVDPRTGTVLVFGTINAGYAPNAISESGVVSGTLRTADITTWRKLEPLFKELVGQVLAPTGCDYEISYTRGVPPVINDDLSTALLVDAARKVDPQAVVEAPQSSGGEDFSWYLENVPGSMARLGSWSGEGSTPDLHQANLVVDERSIGVGVRLFASLVEEYSSGASATGQFLD